MLVDTLDITNKLFEVLKADTELEGCVAQFSKEGMGLSRSIFPFLLLEYPSFREKQLQAVRGLFVYGFEIYVGVKNLAPGVAYKGNGSGKKGVDEICKDVVNVVKNNFLSGALFISAYNIRIDPKFTSDDAETLMIGRVSFNADVRFRH